MAPVVTLAVEGALDEVVLGRVVRAVGASPGSSYGKRGKDYLRQKASGFNNAARFAPWVLLADLDDEAECAPDLRRGWLPEPATMMCFRIAVRAIESWLLSDPSRLSGFLGVSPALIPPSPEQLDDPKQAMVELAARSSRMEIREGMPPRPGSGIRTGPAYTGRLIEFSLRSWRPQEARKQADSLDRCMRAVSTLVRQCRRRQPVKAR